MSSFLGLYNYWIVIFLMMAGFYNVIARGNLIRKLIGLISSRPRSFCSTSAWAKSREGPRPSSPKA